MQQQSNLSAEDITTNHPSSGSSPLEVDNHSPTGMRFTLRNSDGSATPEPTQSTPRVHPTYLFTKIEPTSHGASILSTHIFQCIAQPGRTAEEDPTVGIGVFIRYRLEHSVPLVVRSLDQLLTERDVRATNCDVLRG